MKPRYTEQALADLEEAREFCDLQDPGLGLRFLRRMQYEVSVLVQTAGSHRVSEGFHCFVTRRFHQLIYYEMDAGTPVIVAVVDGRRDPDHNQRKLSDR